MSILKRRIRINWFVLLVQVGMVVAILLLSGAFTNRKLFYFCLGMLAMWILVGVLFRRFSLVAEQVVWPNTIGRADDRGTLVRVGHVPLKDMALSQDCRMMLAFVMGVRKPHWFQRKWVYLLCVVGVFVAWNAWVSYGPRLVDRDVARYGGIAVLFMFVYVVGRLVRRVILRDTADALRSIGHCSVCGYDMKTLKPQNDGCTVCSECGAAWRVKPMPR